MQLTLGRVFGMLIPFLYAISPRTQSLRLVRVPVTKILGDDFHSLIPLIKDKNSLSPIFSKLFKLIKWTIAATPHTYDKVIENASQNTNIARKAYQRKVLNETCLFFH